MSALFDRVVPGLLPVGPEVTDEARLAGVRVYRVDLRQVTDKPSLMAALAAGLGLPDYFGHNWDALYDVLTDPDVLGARVAIVFAGLPGLSGGNTDLAEALTDVIAAAQAGATESGLDRWAFTSAQE